MDPEVVYNQDDLAFSVLDELFEEAYQQIRVEGLFECHPLHLTLVVDGADKATVKTSGRLPNNRCFALGRKAAAGMRLGFDRGFVAPPDLRILSLCLLLYVGICFLHPAFDFRWSLLVGTFKRALRREAPAFQDHAHTLQSINHSVTLCDKFPALPLASTTHTSSSVDRASYR